MHLATQLFGIILDLKHYSQWQPPCIVIAIHGHFIIIIYFWCFASLMLTFFAQTQMVSTIAFVTECM